MGRYIGVVCFLILALTTGCGRRVAIVPGQPPRAPMTGDTAKYVSKVSTGFDNSQFRNDTDDTISVETGTNHADVIPTGIVQTYDLKIVTQSNTGTHKIITWCGDDAQSNTYLLGINKDDSGWDLVTDSTLPMVGPGSPSVGMTWGYVAHLASGVTMTYNGKVVGKEWLNTDAGKFETYKIADNLVTETDSLLGKEVTNTTGFTWVSPQVSDLFIKSEAKTDVGQMGGPESRSMRLTELNLAGDSHT